ncbi:hypothetical protein TRAPUB_11509 [Trametes pubescens]|uniref:Uncharacterized protein n=1 Tax=Trametes pubescens TaxID=154538 RepID=A0A1M2VWG8_TRAPU|nr:hypothetical protein TRAPUB_11509 [Trametes pubescens]
MVLRPRCFAQIVFEALASLFLAIVGATLRSSPLREVTWRSEMKRRAQEEVEDPRLSFATFAQRAGIAPQAPSPSSL